MSEVPLFFETALQVRLRSLMSTALRRFRQANTSPRHTNPYATHIPVLVALSRIVPVKTVLELGSGTVSTFCFLDRTVFHHLQTIVSYENDFDWYQLVSARAQDSRLDLKFTPDAMCTVAQTISLSDFDLIFVDDSKSLVERSQTIRELALRRSEIRGLVVIHDFEQQAYQVAASSFAYRKRFKAFNPETGLVWNHRCIDPNLIHQVARIIHKNANHIDPTDVAAWLTVFKKESS